MVAVGIMEKNFIHKYDNQALVITILFLVLITSISLVGHSQVATFFSYSFAMVYTAFRCNCIHGEDLILWLRFSTYFTIAFITIFYLSRVQL